MVFTGGVILFGGDIGAAYLLESSVIETVNNTAIETMNFIMYKYPIQWKKG